MKKLIVFALIALLALGMLTACNKNSNDKNHTWVTISKTDAFNLIHFTNGVVCLYGPDLISDLYCVPTKAWVQDVYAPALKKFLFDNGVSIPSDPDNNCVKFSSYGLAVGNILHRKGEGPRQTSLAIGITDYVASLFDWHSINVFLVQDGYGGYELYYLEPQTGQQIPNKDVDGDWCMFRM